MTSSIIKATPIIGYYQDGFGNNTGKYIGGAPVTGSDFYALQVTGVSASGSAITDRNPNADAIAQGTPLGQDVINYPYLFDPVASAWNRQRGNHSGTLLASAARTATVNSANITNYNHRGVHIIINVTAITATPSVVPTIQGYDPLSTTYYTLLTGVAITATGYTILKIYPGIGAVANAAANDILPNTWRISMAHADADSITYSVGYQAVI